MMKMTKTEYAFEGSTAEFATVMHLFGVDAGTVSAPDIDAELSPDASGTAPTEGVGNQQADNSSAELSDAAVKSFFERSPQLSEAQAAAIKAVQQAGQNGTTIAEIATAMNVKAGSVKALFRLLGKRVRHTKEWPNEIEFFHRVWEGHQNRYVLHDAVRAFLDAGNAKL